MMNYHSQESPVFVFNGVTAVVDVLVCLVNELVTSVSVIMVGSLIDCVVQNVGSIPFTPIDPRA